MPRNDGLTGSIPMSAGLVRLPPGREVFDHARHDDRCPAISADGTGAARVLTPSINCGAQRRHLRAVVTRLGINFEM